MGQDRANKRAPEDEEDDASDYEDEEEEADEDEDEELDKDGNSKAKLSVIFDQYQQQQKQLEQRMTLRMQLERLTGSWNVRQLKTVKSWLLTMGFGRWEGLLESDRPLSNTKHCDQVKAMAECLVQLCLHTEREPPQPEINSTPAPPAPPAPAPAPPAPAPAPSSSASPAASAALKTSGSFNKRRQYHQILEEKSFYAEVLLPPLPSLFVFQGLSHMFLYHHRFCQTPCHQLSRG